MKRKKNSKFNNNGQFGTINRLIWEEKLTLIDYRNDDNSKLLSVLNVKLQSSGKSTFVS